MNILPSQTVATVDVNIEARHDSDRPSSPYRSTAIKTKQSTHWYYINCHKLSINTRDCLQRLRT